MHSRLTYGQDRLPLPILAVLVRTGQDRYTHLGCNPTQESAPFGRQCEKGSRRSIAQWKTLHAQAAFAQILFCICSHMSYCYEHLLS